MIERTTLVLVFAVMFVTIIQGKSTEEPLGPCVGMDCLHGILMHNDENLGEEHKAEDQYLRFKVALQTGKTENGPKDAAEEFHGALMHGDEESGIHHDENEKILPEIKTEAGPKDMNTLLHEGMHGEEGTHKHKWDNDADKINVRKGPLDNEQMMHGLLMHGDANHGEDMHEVEEIDPNKKIGPGDAEELMHGVLMHGDASKGHAHEESKPKGEEIDPNKKIGPGNAEELMHGVLMHGDASKGHAHEESKPKGEDKDKVIGPNRDLHGILMHGDSELGHDHSDEDANTKHEVFRDITKILDMELGEDLLRIIDLEKILEKDRKEYAEWIINNPKFQDETMMGSTYATVPDSIVNDIELMKKRYLSQSSDSTESDPPKEDLPFTAEDANSVMNMDSHRGEGEDMRHDLELLGSTEPLNARHKVNLELLKAKMLKAEEEK